MSDKINPSQDSKHTYWYHPESDSVYISNDSSIAEHPELVEEGALDDGHSHQVEESWYVHKLVEQIEADPDPKSKLPEGVTALIKSAVIYEGTTPKKHQINGAIFFDRDNRGMPHGYMINTTKIIGREPGGIYVTQSGSKYLVEFAEDKHYEVKING